MARTTARQALEIGIKYVREHPDEWRFLLGAVSADIDARRLQPFRLSHYVEQLRAHGLKFCNAAAPYVVRRLERETGAQFTRNSSKIDILMSDETD